jgi:hypothetical protein
VCRSPRPLGSCLHPFVIAAVTQNLSANEWQTICSRNYAGYSIVEACTDLNRIVRSITNIMKLLTLVFAVFCAEILSAQQHTRQAPRYSYESTAPSIAPTRVYVKPGLGNVTITRVMYKICPDLVLTRDPKTANFRVLIDLELPNGDSGGIHLNGPWTYKVYGDDDELIASSFTHTLRDATAGACRSIQDRAARSNRSVRKMEYRSPKADTKP